MILILPPPNLYRLGLPKAVPDDRPDLITIWRTPYPVITPYLELCHQIGVTPFAGGTMEEQGPASKTGYINSGYRPYVVAGNLDSPHMYALAIDLFVLPPLKVIAVARVAATLYNRIGIYPDRHFIHCDQAPQIWMEKHHKAVAWVQLGGKTTYFETKEEAFRFALAA